MGANFFVFIKPKNKSVGLKISSLKWSGADYPSSEYVPEIPASIGYGNRIRRDEDIGISEVDAAVRDLGLSTQGSFFSRISSKYICYIFYT